LDHNFVNDRCDSRLAIHLRLKDTRNRRKYRRVAIIIIVAS